MNRVGQFLLFSLFIFVFSISKAHAVNPVPKWDFCGAKSHFLRGASAVKGEGVLLWGSTNPWTQKRAFFVTKLRSDGSPDPSFGENGSVCGTKLEQSAVYRSTQTDGSLLIRLLDEDAEESERLIRLSPTGKLDSSFGDGGSVLASDKTKFPDNPRYVEDGDGTILAENSKKNSKFTFWRIDKNGKWDTEFGERETPVSNILCRLRRDKKRRIFCFGYDADESPYLARFHPTGELDTTFGDKGQLIKFPVASSEVAIQSMEFDADGKIVLALHTPEENDSLQVIRLNEDGSYDKTFNETGSHLVKIGTGLGEWGNAGEYLVIAKDGSIYASFYQTRKAPTGGYWRTIGIAKLQPDGRLDKKFGEGLGYRFFEEDVTKLKSAYPYALVGLEDGRLVYFFMNMSAPVLYSVRVLPTGQIDTTYGDKGLVPSPRNFPSSLRGR